TGLRAAPGVSAEARAMLLRRRTCQRQKSREETNRRKTITEPTAPPMNAPASAASVIPPAPSCGPPGRDHASPCPTAPCDVPRRAVETLPTPPWRYPPGWRQKCPRAAPACPQRHPPWAQPPSWPKPYGLHSSSQEQASSPPTLHPSSR